MVGKTFLARSIDPREGDSTPWALISHGIAEKLFTVEKDREIVGQIAESVIKVSHLVWEVTESARAHNYYFGTQIITEDTLIFGC